MLEADSTKDRMARPDLKSSRRTDPPWRPTSRLPKASRAFRHSKPVTCAGDNGQVLLSRGSNRLECRQSLARLECRARRSSGQSMVTVVHGVAYTSVASTLSTHRITTVAPENGARSAAVKAAEA